MEVRASHITPRQIREAKSGIKLIVVNFRDVFAVVYHDLRAVALRSAWTDGDMTCFDKLVAQFADQGALDQPVRVKGDRVYYWDPSSLAVTHSGGNGHRRELGLSRVFTQPCTSNGPWAPGSDNISDPFMLPADTALWRIWHGRKASHTLTIPEQGGMPAPQPNWRPPINIKFKFSTQSRHSLWKMAAYRCPLDELC